MASGVVVRYRPDMPGIVIIGTGFGGIGMAIALQRAGFHDFVILEQSEDLGGTWYDNQYPGCACDVPSPLYSYSFELNPLGALGSRMRPDGPAGRGDRDRRVRDPDHPAIAGQVRQLPNVEPITEDITGITEGAGVTADGAAHETDVIVCATGFNVVESVTGLNVAGRDGRKGTPQTMEAFHGITVPGFPNFFMLLGPNTLLGHTSVVFMIESQIQHVMSCLRRLAVDQANTIEVSEPALRHYNDALQRRLRRAVWSEGGHHSWYFDADGLNRTLWPGFSFEYWARSRRARRSAYAVTPGAR
jgi:cation diffusion facilitator CzcD-associated flavoprotein CzcO